MPVSIRIALAQQQTCELHCGSQARPVGCVEIDSLAAAADREFFGDNLANDAHWAPKFPQLTALGRRLFQWLDGPEGWLRTGFTSREALADPLQAQDLNPATESPLRKLAHRHWELAHDGTAFSPEQGVQPVRVMQSRPANAGPADRSLRLLFMATSPEDILETTRQQPSDTVVEESGSVSQLQNLVASFGTDQFGVSHIAGHGTIEGGTPQFVTEDEPGGEQRTTAEQLAEAFGRRWPRLLSGCHRAQAPNRGTIPSMAYAPVKAGADAVLGLARPVFDSTGSFAATQLYRALAIGETPLEAVAATGREMLRAFLKDTGQASSPDWRLLRIYQGVPDTAALVAPLKTRKREQIQRKAPEAEFLEAEGNVKVAGASAFFGRRHEAQNPGFERVVLVGPVDENRLRQRLSDKFGRLLRAPDDFEPNIPEANVEDGSLRLVPGAWSAPEALSFALEESGAASRLMATSSSLPDFFSVPPCLHGEQSSQSTQHARSNH